jgi:RND family efflux transporter MFP subunit
MRNLVGRGGKDVKFSKRRTVNLLTFALIAGLAVIAAACGKRSEAAAKGPAPLSVEVATVEQKDTPIYNEWIGTLDGYVNADIKAQVSGYLMTQAFTEGSFVKQGDLLFQIDPRPFQAALDQAQGQLSQANGQVAQARAQLAQSQAGVAVAEANQVRTQLDVDRYIPLAQQQAITQQDLDNATQNNQAAKAQVQLSKAQVETAQAQIVAAQASVEQAKAAVDTAQLNLGFTRLVAPIDGIVGQAQQQVGALVSPSSGAVTTVSTLDPIKVYFTPSEQEYLEFHRINATQEKLDAARKGLRLELILSDGTVYPAIGSFYFADRQVNQSTGAIRVAGLFPNPGNTLRPGQYARIRFSFRSKPRALLVPQRAVTELQGVYQIGVVNPDNTVAIRNVKPSDRVGNQWIIDEGVNPGEHVVAEGVQKIRPGMSVVPKPYSPQANAAAGR